MTMQPLQTELHNVNQDIKNHYPIILNQIQFLCLSTREHAIVSFFSMVSFPLVRWKTDIFFKKGAHHTNFSYAWWLASIKCRYPWCPSMAPQCQKASSVIFSPVSSFLNFISLFYGNTFREQTSWTKTALKKFKRRNVKAQLDMVSEDL